MGDLVLNKSHETSLWTYNIDKIKVCSLEQILWKKAPTHPSPTPQFSPPPDALLWWGFIIVIDSLNKI